MKNVLKRLLLLVIVLMISFTGITNAKDINHKDYVESEVLEIYQIKQKEDVLVKNGAVLSFYEDNYTNQDIIKEELARRKRVILQNDIVNFATQFIGNPYVLGGTSLTNGADCSGFVQTIFASFGITVPRSTGGQSVSGVEISVEEIQLGDIISYGYNGYVSHSAIYIGNDTIVHASTPELGIRYDNMYMMPIITIRRVV